MGSLREDGSEETIMSAAPQKNQKKGGMLTLVLVIIIIALSYFAFSLNKQLNDLKTNPQKMSQDELKGVLDQVGKLMVLPAGEQPTLATIANLAPLKDQPFFANAKVGDKLLLYTSSRKAILFSPTDNKIIEVAPINVGAPAPAEAAE